MVDKLLTKIVVNPFFSWVLTPVLIQKLSQSMQTGTI